MQYVLFTTGEIRALYEQMRDPQQLTLSNGGGVVVDEIEREFS